MAKEEKNQEKKIIIDEDWKHQAQKEKEVLKEKEKQEHKQEETPQKNQPLPKGDFAALVSMLATQGLFAMGLISTEKGKEPKKDLSLAKFHIDMLETIEEKTKGNLNENEEKMLTQTLSQLRMGYVQVSK